ncbi:MAG TPA: DNA-formamidopyrimidine glycosylase family protein, partial [Longimicrobium sp.]
MPELPDVEVYLEALERRIVGQVLAGIRLANPFVLRTVQPRPAEFAGARVTGVRRMGKRIVIELDEDRFIVIHLMVAGRFRWLQPGANVPGKIGLAAFDFDHGTLALTEAGSKRRASIHLLRGAAALQAFDRGGLEPMDATREQFRAALLRERHTVKRSLTDPRLFSGIGNAYSDEILHAARLSPLKLTRSLSDEEVERLHEATRVTLNSWTDILRAETGEGFPEEVTAFRKDMAVHGRFKQP